MPATRTTKTATIIWAVLIGGGIIALAGSIMLPSTKRARVDLDSLREAPTPTTVESRPVMSGTKSAVFEPDANVLFGDGHVAPATAPTQPTTRP